MSILQNFRPSLREHSAILSTFIKLPFVIKICVLSIFEGPFYTGFTVEDKESCSRTQHSASDESPNSYPSISSRALNHFASGLLKKAKLMMFTSVILFVSLMINSVRVGTCVVLQTVWIQIRPDILSGLIWIQTV